VFSDSNVSLNLHSASSFAFSETLASLEDVSEGLARCHWLGYLGNLIKEKNWEQGLFDMVVPTLSTTPLSDEDSQEDTTELDCAIVVYV